MKKELLDVAYLYYPLRKNLKIKLKLQLIVKGPINKLILSHKKGFSFFSSNAGSLLYVVHITGHNTDQSAWW
jgi:hypothetical protein